MSGIKMLGGMDSRSRDDLPPPSGIPAAPGEKQSKFVRFEPLKEEYQDDSIEMITDRKGRPIMIDKPIRFDEEAKMLLIKYNKVIDDFLFYGEDYWSVMEGGTTSVARKQLERCKNIIIKIFQHGIIARDERNPSKPDICPFLSNWLKKYLREKAQWIDEEDFKNFMDNSMYFYRLAQRLTNALHNKERLLKFYNEDALVVKYPHIFIGITFQLDNYTKTKTQVRMKVESQRLLEKMDYENPKFLKDLITWEKNCLKFFSHAEGCTKYEIILERFFWDFTYGWDVDFDQNQPVILSSSEEEEEGGNKKRFRKEENEKPDEMETVAPEKEHCGQESESKNHVLNAEKQVEVRNLELEQEKVWKEYQTFSADVSELRQEIKNENVLKNQRKVFQELIGAKQVEVIKFVRSSERGSSFSSDPNSSTCESFSSYDNHRARVRALTSQWTTDPDNMPSSRSDGESPDEPFDIDIHDQRENNMKIPKNLPETRFRNGQKIVIEGIPRIAKDVEKIFCDIIQYTKSVDPIDCSLLKDSLIKAFKHGLKKDLSEKADYMNFIRAWLKPKLAYEELSERHFRNFLSYCIDTQSLSKVILNALHDTERLRLFYEDRALVVKHRYLLIACLHELTDLDDFELGDIPNDLDKHFEKMHFKQTHANRKNLKRFEISSIALCDHLLPEAMNQKFLFGQFQERENPSPPPAEDEDEITMGLETMEHKDKEIEQFGNQTNFWKGEELMSSSSSSDDSDTNVKQDPEIARTEKYYKKHLAKTMKLKAQDKRAIIPQYPPPPGLPYLVDCFNLPPIKRPVLAVKIPGPPARVISHHPYPGFVPDMGTSVLFLLPPAHFHLCEGPPGPPCSTHSNALSCSSASNLPQDFFRPLKWMTWCSHPDPGKKSRMISTKMTLPKIYVEQKLEAPSNLDRTSEETSAKCKERSSDEALTTSESDSKESKESRIQRNKVQRKQRKQKIRRFSVDLKTVSTIELNKGEPEKKLQEKEEIRHKHCHQRSVSDTGSIVIPNNNSNEPPFLGSKMSSNLSLANRYPSSAASTTSAEFFEAPPQPPAGGWIAPRPQSRNQTLDNYIASGEFSRYQAQLDRENAHIILSEAVIQGLNKANFEKKSEISTVLPTDFVSQESHIETDFDDLSIDLTRISNLNHENLKEDWEENRSNHSATTTNLSENEIEISRPMISKKSAEFLALNLLMRNGRDLKMPKVSDINWLSQENYFDQFSNFSFELEEENLVGNIENKRSENDDFRSNSQQRGNSDWAPPRPQLIFEVHEKKKLAVSMKEQNFLCRGCGISVSFKYMKTFRYCSYFGAYFCTSCHTNQESCLPAKIVQKWNFKMEPVSDYAYSVISSLSNQRLFDMNMINPELVKKVSKLRQAIEMRQESALLFPFIMACKDAEAKGFKATISCHDFETPSIFTLNELCSIRVGEFNKELKTLLDGAKAHILQCKLCHLLGHICEGCRSNDILFPFLVSQVYQCPNCKACYHLPCYENVSNCSKCLRLKERRKSRLQHMNENVELVPSN